MDDLSIAVWQAPYAPSAAEALSRLDAACERARAQGADLLITPEMFLTGYAIGAGRVAELAEPADGALAQAVAAIAQRHHLAIVCGYPERNPAGQPFNAVQAIGPDGTRLAHYRKTHLFGDMDRAQFCPGDLGAQVFEWRGWRLGLLICYDVEYPETVRLLALQGAEAVLVPTANMAEFDEVPRLLVPARACENRLYLAYANACGTEGALHYGGLSTVAAPDGQIVAVCGTAQELRCVSLTRQALVSAAAGSQLAFRRPDLYSPLTGRPVPGPP